MRVRGLIQAVVVLSVLVFAGGLAHAQQPARGNFFQRTFGWFQPKSVRQALKQARQARSLQEHDRVLIDFARANAGTLPVFSIVKLARKADGSKAAGTILSSYAKAHAGKLSFGAIRDLTKKGTKTYGGQHEIARQLLKLNSNGLSLNRQRKLKFWSVEKPPPASDSAGVTSGIGVNTAGHLTVGNHDPGGLTIDVSTGKMGISLGGGMSVGL